MIFFCKFVEHINILIMNKSQLVNILKTFSSKEIREMRKWLQSPIHNQRQDVIQLFNFFFEDNNLAKEDCLVKSFVFSWVYPKETYDDAKMRQAIFFLMKCIEDFLTYQELTTDKIKLKIEVAKIFRKRKLNKLFQKNIKITEKLQQEAGIRNEKYFTNEYNLQLEKYAHLSKINRITPNLQQASDALDAAFLISKLKQSCLMLTHQSVYQKEYEIGLLHPLLSVIQNKSYLDIPGVAIYFYVYKTLIEKEDTTHFHLLKDQIKVSGHLFPLDEIRDIYLMAINYCIGRMNKGVKYFIREAFELFRLGFEKKILIEKNQINRVTFHNVVSISLVLREYEWVRVFIQDYQQYLEEKHKQGFVDYSLARLHYEEKNYDQAMKLLVQEAHYDDIIINLSAKTILAKMYYELEEFDVLESLLESMRTYIQRKKVMGYHKNNYRNVVRYTKKLLKATPYSSAKKEKLKNEISEVSPLTEKEWLLNQLSKI